MKKILLLTTAAFIFTGCSSTGSKEDTASVKSAKSAVNNTLVAHSYNRNNSVSTKDVKKIASSSYKASLNMANSAKKKAQAVGYEWNTIRKLIKKAGKDHKAGNDKAAIKKLNTAITHAALGVQQAKDQKNAAPRF